MSGEDDNLRARTELYFGLRIPSGGGVSEQEWDNFLNGSIIPEFPGLTVFDADGVWWGKHGGVVKEPTKVVVLIHADVPDCYVVIDKLRTLYKQMFWQESVLKVTTLVSAEF